MPACTTLFGGGTEQRPNRPGEAIAERRTYDPDTGVLTDERRLTVTNDENPEAPLTGEVNDRITFGTGGSAPFEWETAVTAQPSVTAGIFVFVVGLVILCISLYPGIKWVVPNGIPFTIMGGGVFLIVLPFMLGVVKVIVSIIAGAVILGALFYYGNKLGWIGRMTGPEAQKERLAKGDKATAAALAFLDSGGDKDKARAIKGVQP